MPSALKRLLESQLGHHVRIHMDSRDLSPIQVPDSPSARKKRSSTASHTLHIVAKLPLYTISCGSVVRKGIQASKPAGMIVLLKSTLGYTFHVELVGSSSDLAITRVSTGGTAKDLQKAILRGRKSPSRTRPRLEQRVFRVPAMHLSAIWGHHPKNKDADVFIPYTPNFAGLTVGRTYSAHRFVPLLKKQATHSILRWYDRYERGLIPA